MRRISIFVVVVVFLFLLSVFTGCSPSKQEVQHQAQQLASAIKYSSNAPKKVTSVITPAGFLNEQNIVTWADEVNRATDKFNVKIKKSTNNRDAVYKEYISALKILIARGKNLDLTGVGSKLKKKLETEIEKAEGFLADAETINN